jgi:serine O-acetyltransferase
VLLLSTTSRKRTNFVRKRPYATIVSAGGPEGRRVRPNSGDISGGTRCSLREYISADLRGAAKLKGVRHPSLGGYIDLLSMPGVLATILFRISDDLHRRGLRPLSRLVFFINFCMFNVELYPGSDIGPGLVSPHPGGFGVAKGCVIGRDFHALGGVRVGGGAAADESEDGFPRLGDGCFMLDGAKAFGPITIGDRTVVAASSVVLTDLPANVIAAGIPARVIKPRDPEA